MTLENTRQNANCSTTSGGTLTSLAGHQPGAPAFTATSWKVSACQFCNSNCRMHVGLTAGRVVEVRGEQADPVQAGQLCVKASMMGELLVKDDRITTPLERVSGDKGDSNSRFQPITWDQAYAKIAKRFHDLYVRGEARAIANRTTGRMIRGSESLVARVFEMLGSPNNTDVGPTCNDAGGDALRVSFGLGNFTNGYGVDGNTGEEDLGAAQHLLFFGTNQAETHPVTFEYLLRERAKTGATLTVVDPRSTVTTEFADTWIAPKPHTDFALVLGMLSHILSESLYDENFVTEWVTGFDELRQHFKTHDFAPEWAAGVCGIDASLIRDMAEEYASAKPAALFCNAGISHQLGAFQTYRTLTFLAALTGNVGVPGGGCNFMHNTWPGDLLLEPIPGLPRPDSGAALPLGPDSIVDAILTGNPYPIHAVVLQGNPIIASANSHKVRKAFEQVEFLAYTGLFMEEPALYADLVLPVASGLEIEGVYMRRDDRAIRWQEQAVKRVGQSKPDWEMWLGIGRAMAYEDITRREQWLAAFPKRWDDYGTLWAEFVEHTPGMAGMTQQRLEESATPLRWPCPSETHPGVSTLYLDHSSWYEAAESLGYPGKRFLTPSGKVEITTPDLEKALTEVGLTALPLFYTHPEVAGTHPTLTLTRRLVSNPLHRTALTPKGKLAASVDDSSLNFPLMGITGRPSVAHFATLTHWTTTGRMLNGIRLVQIHPTTAASRSIEDGAEVIIRSPRGAVRGTALLWEGIRPDTIFVPNTYGPAQPGPGGASAHSYDPVNTLVDDKHFDILSGQQAYKCFGCDVELV